jgi:hypothetical protein
MATGFNPIAIARGAAQAKGKFILIPLGGPGAFIFDFFPTAPITHSRRANWPEQDITTGTKPLFYMNKEPREEGVQEVWLDKSDTNESITPQIEHLFAMQVEIQDGTPPPVLVIYGDRQDRRVLEEIHVEEMLHAPAGHPVRAKVTLTFKELQEASVGW